MKKKTRPNKAKPENKGGLTMGQILAVAFGAAALSKPENKDRPIAVQDSPNPHQPTPLIVAGYGERMRGKLSQREKASVPTPAAPL